jgi:molybdenum cofactor biosynthesis enzyme
MCKGVDRAMVIEQIQLEEKAGGRSGTFTRPTEQEQPVAQ